jgi:hypothetical protein
VTFSPSFSVTFFEQAPKNGIFVLPKKKNRKGCVPAQIDDVIICDAFLSKSFVRVLALFPSSVFPKTKIAASSALFFMREKERKTVGKSNRLFVGALFALAIAAAARGVDGGDVPFVTAQNFNTAASQVVHDAVSFWVFKASI